MAVEADFVLCLQSSCADPKNTKEDQKEEYDQSFEEDKLHIDALRCSLVSRVLDNNGHPHFLTRESTPLGLALFLGSGGGIDAKDGDGKHELREAISEILMDTSSQ
jgi:hypothetical protein